MLLPTMPARSGYMPVAMDGEFTRVTVGNTECPWMKFTPASRSLCKFGVSVGLNRSGRMPSSTNTNVRLARLVTVCVSSVTVYWAAAENGARDAA